MPVCPPESIGHWKSNYKQVLRQGKTYSVGPCAWRNMDKCSTVQVCRNLKTKLEGGLWRTHQDNRGRFVADGVLLACRTLATSASESYQEVADCSWDEEGLSPTDFDTVVQESNLVEGWGCCFFTSLPVYTNWRRYRPNLHNFKRYTGLHYNFVRIQRKYLDPRKGMIQDDG